MCVGVAVALMLVAVERGADSLSSVVVAVGIALGCGRFTHPPIKVATLIRKTSAILFFPMSSPVGAPRRRRRRVLEFSGSLMRHPFALALVDALGSDVLQQPFGRDAEQEAVQDGKRAADEQDAYRHHQQSADDLDGAHMPVEAPQPGDRLRQ